MAMSPRRYGRLYSGDDGCAGVGVALHTTLARELMREVKEIAEAIIEDVEAKNSGL